MSHRGREGRDFSECPWLSQNSGTGTIQRSAFQEPELSLVGVWWSVHHESGAKRGKTTVLSGKWQVASELMT